MTVEELLKPRYKVIADYPGSIVSIGTVITQTDPHLWQAYLSQYPHLFRPLQWWEDRKPEDMPGYLKYKESDESYSFVKIIKWDGIENEPRAKEWYCELTGNKIEETGFIQHLPFYGGSPDSKVIDINSNDGIGGLEIKCPYNSVNHFWHCMIKDAEYFKSEHPEYYWQCVSHMICLNAAWCDFVSFDPRIDHEIGLHIFTLKRNDQDCAVLLDRIDRAMKYKIHLRHELGIPDVIISSQ